MSRRLVDGKQPKPVKGSEAEQRMLQGRPSQLELTPALLQKISDALRIGGYIETAAALNGIGYATLRSWVLKGKTDPESLYGAFLAEVEKAVAEAEFRDLAGIDSFANGRPAEYAYEVVRNAAGEPVILPDGKPLMQIAKDGDGNPIIKRSEVRPSWQAAAWKLERRNPKRWGRYDRLDIDAVLNTRPEDESKPVNEKAAITGEQYEEVKQKATKLLLERRDLGDLEDA